jgi:hypothetical protein
MQAKLAPDLERKRSRAAAQEAAAREASAAANGHGGEAGALQPEDAGADGRAQAELGDPGDVGMGGAEDGAPAWAAAPDLPGGALPGCAGPPEQVVS